MSLAKEDVGALALVLVVRRRCFVSRHDRHGRHDKHGRHDRNTRNAWNGSHEKKTKCALALSSKLQLIDCRRRQVHASISVARLAKHITSATKH